MGSRGPAFGAQPVESDEDPDHAELHPQAQALGEREPGLHRHNRRRNHAVRPGQQRRRRLYRGDNAKLLANVNGLADDDTVGQPVADDHAIIVGQPFTDHHPDEYAAAVNVDDAHAEHADEFTNSWRPHVGRGGTGGRLGPGGWLGSSGQACAGGQPGGDREGAAQPRRDRGNGAGSDLYGWRAV